MLTDLSPLCGREEFESLVAEMVADSAPRLFALVQELGDRADGRIAGWGVTFESGQTDVIANGRYLSLKSPESALRFFSRGKLVRARTVWV